MIINPSSNRSEPVIPITGTPNIRTQLWIDPTVEDQNSSYYTAADTLTNSTKALFGLEENAVPDDAFKALLEKTENIPVPEAGVQIKCGSYVGSGTYGIDNPNSITFDFEPKFVIVSDNSSLLSSGDYIEHTLMWMDGLTSANYNTDYDYYANCSVSVDGNTFSWYLADCNNTMTDKAISQLNKSGSTYYYFALGIGDENGVSSGGSTVTPENVYTKEEIDAMLAGIGGGSSMELLWENASPLSNFAAQTISLDLSEYNEVKIYYRGKVGANNNWNPQDGIGCVGYFSTIALKGEYSALALPTVIGETPKYICNSVRGIYVTDTGIQFNASQYVLVGGSSYNRETGDMIETECVPYKIYGIKGVTVA